jgi:cytochrome c553
MFRILQVALVFMLMFLTACKHQPVIVGDPDPDPTNIPCDPDTVYFENDILPLLQASCAYAGCHDAATAQDGVNLTNYFSIIQTGDIKPGNPNGSDLYEVITENDPDKRMPPPPNNPLSAAQTQLIFTWIQQGAKNNKCDDCDTTDVSYAQNIVPLLNQNCVICHSGANPQAGLNLTSLAELQGAITYKNLMPRVKHETGYAVMPPSGAKISDCNIRQLELWIADGMPDN